MLTVALAALAAAVPSDIGGPAELVGLGQPGRSTIKRQGLDKTGAAGTGVGPSRTKYRPAQAHPRGDSGAGILGHVLGLARVSVVAESRFDSGRQTQRGDCGGHRRGPSPALGWPPDGAHVLMRRRMPSWRPGYGSGSSTGKCIWRGDIFPAPRGVALSFAQSAACGLGPVGRVPSANYKNKSRWQLWRITGGAGCEGDGGRRGLAMW